jgi:hypothetical protein
VDNLTSINIAAWLAVAAFLIALVNGSFRLWSNLRGKSPEPPNEQLELASQEITRRVQQLEVRAVLDTVCATRHAESAKSIETVTRQIAELSALRIADAKDAGASREKMYQAVKEMRLEVTSQVQNLSTTTAKNFQDVDRALGRLEGKLESQRS